MCDCISKMNGLLKEHNAGVVFNLFGPARACVETYKLDAKKRGKPPILQASFCPFCGEKYPDAKDAPTGRPVPVCEATPPLS